MREKSEATPENRESVFSRKIGEMEARKLRVKRRGVQGIWLGLGMFGLIGWAIAIPTLLGTLLGVYIDKHHPGIHSWTLSLLIIGLFFGCMNAWHWIAKEEKAIQEDREEGERKDA